MPDDFFVTAYPVLTILVGVGTLGGFIYKMGAWINQKAEQKAAALKAVTEGKADELRKYAEDVAREVREINEKQISDLQNRLNILDGKIDKMLGRADLVNGNVSDLRTDLLGIQQDIIELYGQESPTARKSGKRREFDRRQKERQIERNRINQSEKRGGRES